MPFSRKEKLNFSFLGSGKIKRFWLQKLCLYIATFIVILVIHGLLIGLVYELNIFKMPTEKIHQLIDTQLSPNGIQKIAAPYLHKMADNTVLRPYAQYLIGFFMVFGRVEGGNTTYFFGQVTNQSFRAYFPMVFLIKESLPLLILLLFSIAVGLTMLLKKNLPCISEKNLDQHQKLFRRSHRRIFDAFFHRFVLVCEHHRKSQYRLPPSLSDLAVHVYFDRQRSDCFWK